MDPEENSAEFMGILIKVGTQAVLRTLCSIRSMFYAAFIWFWVYGKAFTDFVVILCQALAKLKKIPETIKAIMERLEPELKQIVKRSTTQIADHAYQRGESLAQESQPRYSTQQGRANPVLVGRIQAGFSILQEDTPLSPGVSLPLVKAVSAWWDTKPGLNLTIKAFDFPFSDMQNNGISRFTDEDMTNGYIKMFFDN